MSIELTHSALCALAVKWLQRSPSAGGPGCTVAVSEVKTGWNGEIPDAFGVRAAGFNDGSVVVEVKTSRADFLADRSKPHRQPGKGIGNWRYFLCPEGLIQPDDLPAGWGLLWVNARGHIKNVAGPLTHKRHGAYVAALAAYKQDADFERERWLLTKLLSRVGDVDAMNQSLKQTYAEQGRLINRVNAQNEEISRLQEELCLLRRQAIDAGLEISRYASSTAAGRRR